MIEGVLMTESGDIVSTTHYEAAVLILDSCYSRVAHPYNSAGVNCQVLYRGRWVSQRAVIGWGSLPSGDGTELFALVPGSLMFPEVNNNYKWSAIV